MTLIETSLQAVLSTFERLTDPTQRLFLPSLFLSFGVALFVVLRHRKKDNNWVGAVREILPSKIYGHPSARLDYKLLFANAVIRALLIAPWLYSAYSVALWTVNTMESTWGAPSPTSWSTAQIMIAYTATLFVAWDLSRYLLHRLMHRIPMLWEFHKVHHSAEVLTPFSLHRSHPVESLLYSVRGILVTGSIAGVFFYFFQDKSVQYELLGVNAVGFIFTALWSNLRHSHIWLSYGPKVERWLISPAQHQIHHSKDIQHHDKNFGTWLSIWDRLGSSLYIPKRQEELSFGLDSGAQNHNPAGLTSALLGPFFSGLQRLVPQHKKTSKRLTRAVAAAAAIFTLFVLIPTDSFAQEEPVVVVVDEDEPKKKKAVKEKKEKAREIQVKTISIIGKRERVSRTPGSERAIKKEELERFKHDDIHRVLVQAPGVYVRGEDGYGLRPNIGMRGASSDRSAKVTLMEDGILIAPAPYSAPAAYYFPLMARIAGVEVFKGPSSIMHGPNTIGGALNLQTRPIPRTLTASADLAYGQDHFGRAHAYVGASSNRFGFLLEGVHIQTNGFKELDGGGDTGFSRSEIVAKARYHTNPANSWFHQVDLRAAYGREASNETYLGLTDADFEATPYRRYAGSQLDQMVWPRTDARIGYHVSYEDIFEVQVVGYRNDFRRDWTKLKSFRGGPSLRDILASPSSGQSAIYYAILSGKESSFSSDQSLILGSKDRTYVSQGIALTSNWRPRVASWLKQDIEFGVRLHNDSIHRDHTDTDYVMLEGKMVRDDTDPTKSTINKGSATAWAFHLHDKIRVGELTLTPGVRAELIGTQFEDVLSGSAQSRRDFVLVPGVGVHYQLTSWWGVLAGLHKGFSPVSPGQDSDILPEESVNYEAGTRFTWDKTRVELIGFFNDYSNLTGECTVSGGCSEDQLNKQFNAGSVHVYGLEASLRQELRGPGRSVIYGSIFYTLTASKFQSNFTSANSLFGDVEEGDALPYVPVHQGTFLGGVRWKPVELHFSVSYTGDMRDVAGQGAIEETERIDQHVVVDLSSNVQLTKNMSLYANINNLLGAEYMVSRRPYGPRPGRPFAILAGLKYLTGP